MAGPKKPKAENALQTLTPDAVEMSLDGHTVRVPMNRQENSIMNMLLAAQMRGMIHKMVKEYRDKESMLSPKELSELARAAKDVATFSAEIYATVEPSEGPGPKKEKLVDKNDFDFSKIVSAKKVEPYNEPDKASQVDGDTIIPGVSEEPPGVP